MDKLTIMKHNTKTTKAPVQEQEEQETPPESPEIQEQDSNEEAPISEEFQQGLMSHLKGANKHELSFARQHISNLEDEQRQKEIEDKPVSMDDYPH